MSWLHWIVLASLVICNIATSSNVWDNKVTIHTNLEESSIFTRKIIQNVNIGHNHYNYINTTTTEIEKNTYIDQINISGDNYVNTVVIDLADITGVNNNVSTSLFQDVNITSEANNNTCLLNLTNNLNVTGRNNAINLSSIQSVEIGAGAARNNCSQNFTANYLISGDNNIFNTTSSQDITIAAEGSENSYNQSIDVNCDIPGNRTTADLYATQNSTIAATTGGDLRIGLTLESTGDDNEILMTGMQRQTTERSGAESEMNLTNALYVTGSNVTVTTQTVLQELVDEVFS